MRSRHIVALVSLLVFLLSGQAGVQGYVWCIGEDGHTALEYATYATYATGDTCGPGAQQQDCHEKESFDLPSQEEHCGPCLDVPSSFQAHSRHTRGHKEFTAQAGAPAIAQTSPVPSFVRVLTLPLYPQPPPRISQTILSHRTVVLLN